MADEGASKSIFCPIPTAHVPLVWAAIEPLIEAAAARGGRRAANDVLAALERGDSQLWMSWRDGGPEMVALTEIHQFPLKRILRFTLCTGRDRANWLGFIDDIRNWAKTKGCTAMEAIARPGWERVLTGWRKTHVCLEVDIG